MSDRLSDKDLESFEDIDSFPEEDLKHLYSIIWKNWKLARETEKEWKKLCDEWAEKYLQLDAENASLRKTKRLRKEGDGDE